MKPQELFDHVVNTLFQQGKRSLKDQQCRFRGSDGCVCAIGSVILDSEYYPDMEGADIYDLINSYNTEDSIVSDRLYGLLISHTLLLIDLQKVHVRFEVELWDQKFSAVANKHGLIYVR
jgi:hypothetical protein